MNTLTDNKEQNETSLNMSYFDDDIFSDIDYDKITAMEKNESLNNNCRINKNDSGSTASTLKDSGLGSKSYSSCSKSPLNFKSQKQLHVSLKENPRRHSVLSQIKTRLRNNAKNNVEIASTCSSIHNCSELTEDDFPLTQNDVSISEDFFSLPLIVKNLLSSERGINELYEWQKECLDLPSVQSRKNLIYSLPTSGGKTLVAEVLMLKEVLVNLKNVIFVLPYISIVQEKVRSLTPFAISLDFSVEEYAGGKGQIPPRKRLKRNTVYIATIEKANLLVNSLFESNRIDEIGLMVVDELHLLCEGGRRGSVLEMALTKVKCKASHIHIIGMSATLTNISDLKVFLNAELYTGDFRPVELKEFVKTGNEIYNIQYNNHLKEIQFATSRVLESASRERKSKDPDMLVFLLSEILPYNSCLIFCPTKKHCENLTVFVIREFPAGLKTYKEDKKRALINSLLEEGSGRICSVLKQTIPYGVAYHHGGLTMEERSLIEEAYSDGTLCCLACTSTLAAGVNLPAKRVIIRAPYVGQNWITAIQYKQMAGRAGRAGLDTSGESYLMVKPEETKMVEKILQTTTEASCSTLFKDNRDGFKIFILNLTGLQLTTTREDIEFIIKQTLYAVQNPSCEISESVNQAINDLIKSRHLVIKEGSLKATSLGMATFKSGLDINVTEVILRDLLNALRCLSLITVLHLLFIVTPYEMMDSISIDIDTYSSVLSKLSKDEQHTAKIIGIPESYAFQLMSGKTSQEVNKKVAHRFYITLILYDLWKQVSIWQVSKRFGVHRGLVCSLLSNAAAFGSCILRFCQELKELFPLCELLPNFLKQLYYCCEPDLITLLELPCVKQGRARQLSAAGFKTLTDVAKTTGRTLSSKVEHLPVIVANQMVAAAKMLLIEKAEALREEAEEMVVGIENITEM